MTASTRDRAAQPLVTLLMGVVLAMSVAAGCGSEPASPPTSIPPPQPVVEVSATPTPAAPKENDGQSAPSFSLPAAGGGSLSLSDLLSESNAAVLVFYRGFF